MKKRKKVLEVVHARAMSNGIRYCSQRQKGYMAVSTVGEDAKYSGVIKKKKALQR